MSRDNADARRCSYCELGLPVFWCVYSSSVKQSLPSVNHEQMTHKHNKWLQIVAQEDISPKLLWSENADFKFSVINEGEDVNKKPRSRRNIASHNEGNADNKRQRNRESEALWSFYTVENPDFLVCRFPRRYIDQSLQSSSSVLRPEE